MGAKVIVFVVAILTTLCPPSWAFTIPLHNVSDTYNSKNLPPNQQLSRTEELINQQSENVRHIMATEQKAFEQLEKQDGGRQVKKEKAIVTIEDDGFATLEELRAKCQHFSRLFGLNPPAVENYGGSDIVDNRQFTTTPAPLRAEYYNSRPAEVARRPVFIRNKPTFIETGSGGFYVTATPMVNEYPTTKKPYWLSTTTYPRVAYNPEQSSSTSTPSTTTKQPTTTTEKIENLTTTTAKPKLKIKFTKFEPVILQKTILSDGRVMYHWHRSLPTAPVDLLAPIVSPIVPTPSLSDYPPLAQRNLDSRSTIKPQSSSTTTTEKSSWLFVPFSNLFGGSHQEETTMVETSTTPPTTTSTVSTTTHTIEVSSTPYLRAVPPQQSDDQKAQLKLVVPVHYGDVDAAISSQNDNKLNYYHKSVGTPPRTPPLQVVKTIQIPQHIPRYSLGYTGAGYGFPAYNGIPYGAGSYGSDYMNYQAYGHAPLDREDKKLDDVTV